MIDQFISQFADIIEVDKSEINLNDAFRDYEEWDSLSMLALIAMIKKQYNLLIPISEFDKLLTIEDVYSYILSRG